MLRPFPLMVPGAPSSSAALEIRSPFDREPVGSVATGDAQTVEVALETAWRLFRHREGWLPVHERVAVLERAAGILDGRREELALLAAEEGGKPLVDSRVEAARATEGLRLCAEVLRARTGREVAMTSPMAQGRRAFTRHEPIGVVVAVSAFNHPLNLIVHQVGPAVAAGCPVIVKPAEVTPLSCLRFVEILREAGLAEEWCQVVVTDDLAVAESLVTDARVGFFSFVGSARVGWGLRSKLAPGVRCTLEHGGAAPMILAEDADLDDVLPRIAKGGFYHAGQVCVSVQRVYAPESSVRDVAFRLAERAAALRVGDPTDPETEVGPLIRPAEVERVHEWVGEAIEAGAQCLCGGDRVGTSCYRPTVLLDPPDDVRVSTLEVFGPVVCVYSHRGLDEAISRANALPWAFQAAVCTRDLGTALHVADRLDASAVLVNDHTAFRVDNMPFGGLRQSGLGTGGIEPAMADMQVEKMVVIRS